MKKSLLFLALAVAWTGAFADASQKPERLSDADLDKITAGGTDNLVSDPGSSVLIHVVNNGRANVSRQAENRLPNGKILCINCILITPPPPPPPPGGLPGGSFF